MTRKTNTALIALLGTQGYVIKKGINKGRVVK